MERNNDIDRNETSVRVIIETLLKGKIIIAVITVAAIILSGTVSLLMPNIYEATAVVEAIPFDLNTSAAKTVDDAATTPLETTSSTNANTLVENLIKMPSMSTDDYLQQITSPDVLNQVIEKLDLKDTTGKLVSAGSLASSISATNTDKTDFIQIRVSYQDPAKAAAIANTLSQCFIEHITTLCQSEAERLGTQITDQIAVQKTILDEKSQTLAQYLAENSNVDVLRGQVEGLKNQIVHYNNDLLDTRTQITSDYNTLVALNALLPAHLKFDLSQFNSIEQDQSSIQVDLNANNLLEALIVVDMNTLQTRLISNTFHKTALENMITEMNESLTAIKIQLTSEQYQYDAINFDIMTAQNTYNIYYQKYNEIKLTAATDIGSAYISLSVSASAPTAPVSPNLKMNLIIAVLLGLLLSCAIVLFMDYWKKSKV